ncbi:esterase-like activity of phytase family protein [Erythrobacter colymbi]|uniref:esterase-like activity of phytase family protein n=1 Tax=Erythrobacter colymbi TaxID=1161202 RepID=UPI000A3C0C04|nr:esterase-like activity of phytase family protein [Erythrobacter colymbi]
MARQGPRARPFWRARWLRPVLLAMVAIGLAPGTFVRTDVGLRTTPARAITAAPVDLGPPPPGLLTLTGSWHLTSDHAFFGGLSALVARGPDGLVAGSDRGFLLDIALDKGAPRPRAESFRFIGRRIGLRREMVDLEALARDPRDGTLWAAYELFNRIERFAPDGTRSVSTPAQIAGWSDNSGPEAMERLSDGRFLMLAEGYEARGSRDRPALLFKGDPVASSAKALEFRFDCNPAFSPVDITEVPGGRVLILLRRVAYRLPPVFDGAIMIADPATIRAGKPWRGEIIQYLGGPGFGENFEGIAYVPDRADPAKGTVWVVSDDNFSVFQRTLLLRFAWQGSGAALQQRAAAERAGNSERAPGSVAGSPLDICQKLGAGGGPAG